MFSKLDFQNVREADALMHFLRTDHPIRMVIATDVPYFNLETLVLAQQVDWEALSTIEIDQVVYDAANGRSPDYSEEKLRSADFVLMKWPVAMPPADEFSNRFVSRFLRTAQACGRLVTDHPGPPISCDGSGFFAPGHIHLQMLRGSSGTI